MGRRKRNGTYALASSLTSANASGRKGSSDDDNTEVKVARRKGMVCYFERVLVGEKRGRNVPTLRQRDKRRKKV